MVAVFKIGSKYVGTTHSLPTRMTLGIPKFLKCINKAQPEPCYKKTQLQSRSHFIFTRAPQPCLEWRVTTACELCISVQECYVCEIYMFCTHFTQRYFKSPSRRTLFCDKFAQLHNDEIPRLSHFAIKSRNADQVKCVWLRCFQLELLQISHLNFAFQCRKAGYFNY